MTRRTMWRVGVWLAVVAVIVLSELAGCALLRRSGVAVESHRG